MNSFPPEVEFQHDWRSYQERVLSELSGYMKDRHLHVVAAPGSGKTVLGLEVVRRLNGPALILAPTLTIRNQWVERLVRMFLPDGHKKPGWISTDIRTPGFLTAATYQALHAAHSGALEEREGINGDETAKLPGHGSTRRQRVNVGVLLGKIGVKTLVVDEAHHLRTEWWKSLIDVKRSLRDIRVVALTATPPYDVPPAEWERYQELCGPIDAEVPVPELIQNGDLCPHQDCVHLSFPSEEEQKHIADFRNSVNLFVWELLKNQDFAAALLEHPWVSMPGDNIEEILSDPAGFSSMLVYLNRVGVAVPRKLLRILGLPRAKIPQFTREWLEILLTNCLYRDAQNYAARPKLMEKLRRELREIGAIERRRVSLGSTKHITKLLVSSVSKLAGIRDIVEIESRSLGDGLRLVVLTDFIRREFLPGSAGDLRPPNKIGVVPIFELLRRRGPAKVKLGVLSGSLVIIPAESAQRLKELASEMRIDPGRLALRPLEHDERYVAVQIQGEDRQRVVRLITRLFSAGGVNVLVGTKSLLGEGWDAPSINSLVLASFVGSYMLSNQMRGRAIRVQAGNPNKTSNVWHLVCVEPGETDPGEDYRMLRRRFRGFVGVSFFEPVIENGVNRLGLGRPPFSKRDVERVNRAMESRAIDREGLRDQWERALQRGKEGVRLVEEIRAPKVSLPRGFVFRNTIAALVLEGLLAGAYLAMHALGKIEFVVDREGLRELLFMIMVAFIIGAIAALPFLLKALWLFIRHGPLASSMWRVGTAVLETLCETGEIATDSANVHVITEKSRSGEVYCSLAGGTMYERSIYLDALREVLGPVENPRYIIMRSSLLLGWLLRIDYHAVPRAIGRRKEHAEAFLKHWKRYVGRARLVYTRSAEGRAVLLRARADSMASVFQRKSERVSCWK